MFYEFHQNNSGGFDEIDEVAGIGKVVIVEADSANEANAFAERIGLYFHGCQDGIDCDCCGDRWSEIWDDKEGTEKPTVYGRPIKKSAKSEWYFPIAVHHKNGVVAWYK